MMKTFSCLSLVLLPGSNVNLYEGLNASESPPPPSSHIRGLGVLMLPEPPSCDTWWNAQAVPAGSSVHRCACRAHCWADCHLGPMEPESWLWDEFELKLYTFYLGWEPRKHFNTNPCLLQILDAFSQKANTQSLPSPQELVILFSVNSIKTLEG